MKYDSPTQKSAKVCFITIDEGNEQQRLDNFLMSKYRGVPKSHIYTIIRKGNVRVNKSRVKPNYKLQIGDVVRVPPIQYEKNHPISSEHTLNQFDLKLKNSLLNSILYEDDCLMIINKPSGLAVHGGSGIKLGLIELLRTLLPKIKSLELVHRLDRDTSGCIIITKKRSVLRELHSLLRENRINKIYHALVKGKVNPFFKVNEPLTKNQLSSGERIVRVDLVGGSPSLTKFRLMINYQDCSLVEARPVTGRTHQIRVHAAIKDHHIAGDIKYGDKAFNSLTKILGLKRLFLHAYGLEFKHPKTREIISITADYDHNLAAVIKKLDKESLV